MRWPNTNPHFVSNIRQRRSVVWKIKKSFWITYKNWGTSESLGGWITKGQLRLESPFSVNPVYGVYVVDRSFSFLWTSTGFGTVFGWVLLMDTKPQGRVGVVRGLGRARCVRCQWTLRKSWTNRVVISPLHPVNETWKIQSPCRVFVDKFWDIPKIYEQPYLWTIKWFYVCLNLYGFIRYMWQYWHETHDIYRDIKYYMFTLL